MEDRIFTIGSECLCQGYSVLFLWNELIWVTESIPDTDSGDSLTANVFDRRPRGRLGTGLTQTSNTGGYLGETSIPVSFCPTRWHKPNHSVSRYVDRCPPRILRHAAHSATDGFPLISQHYGRPLQPPFVWRLVHHQLARQDVHSYQQTPDQWRAHTIRLRFKIDDNNNAGANTLNIISGNNASQAKRPELIIGYSIP